ncbi:BCCT family transporter [Halolactibacillus alkaliphilus]|uniref:BCCT family transporter n=1 Tax=Halolactibacillus alkaliphilus TaxID=442899 RepID=A0A511X3J1_9BACI|nr:BCCT family transporter [Halolactibacillus alkaliphilus]GEN57514.1 BCCT family transporter [Halolactibacillus alkaliphilus]GGN73687.1 BCCT family transporter [Halolactibacillus alkaliphilus]SFO98081.1 choline/glycine/proline betaine transport protein [Halolactibacillus alkaliphilus]
MKKNSTDTTKKSEHEKKQTKTPPLTKEKKELNQRLESERVLAKKLRKAEVSARKEAIKNREPFKGLQIIPTDSLFDKSGKEEIGERNWVKFGFDIHPHVTILSSVILLIFISLTLMFPVEANSLFDQTLVAITKNTGWFMIFSANIFIVAALFFAFSRYGSIVIGGYNAKPEFSRFAWYAMLLSAGMGIGLLFWSVAEPILHLGTPSPMFDSIDPNSPAAAQAAMASTFFHWGIHPWAIYAIVGLGLAFFSYNKGLPLTIRSLFYPLIGNKIYGLWGNIIDILSVLATLMGLATSLGLGVAQVNAGLNHLFDVNISITTQVILIAVITGFATISVIMGLDGGVKRLSEINMVLAGVFLIFVLIAGPTVYIMSGFTQNIGYYIANFMEMSLWAETFRSTNWQGTWTVFYWAWWISWSPFVGMFIARISKGRSVKEFIVGVIIIPTVISFLWMSVFGGTAIFQQLNGLNDLSSIINLDESLALFVMLDNLPLSGLLSIVGIILVTVFFVTSSDSGSLVVDHLTSGGKLDSPVPQRIFWAIMEGVVAATLLVGGGLTALQTASIITGLPFTIILLVMIYSLYLGLRQEFLIEHAVKKQLKKVTDDHIISEVIQSRVQDEALVDAVSELLADKPEKKEHE